MLEEGECPIAPMLYGYFASNRLDWSLYMRITEQSWGSCTKFVVHAAHYLRRLWHVKVFVNSIHLLVSLCSGYQWCRHLRAQWLLAFMHASLRHTRSNAALRWFSLIQTAMRVLSVCGTKTLGHHMKRFYGLNALSHTNKHALQPKRICEEVDLLLKVSTCQ